MNESAFYHRCIVPRGGLGLSVVGSLSGLPFFEQQKLWKSWSVVGAKKKKKKKKNCRRKVCMLQEGTCVYSQVQMWNGQPRTAS